MKNLSLIVIGLTIDKVLPPQKRATNITHLIPG